MIQADTLKSGWKLVKFGDVVRLSKDRAANPEAEGIERYVGLEHIDPDDLRIRRWGLVAEGTTFTSKFKPGRKARFVRNKNHLRKKKEIARYLLQYGDVLLTEGGDADKLGRGTVWEGQITNCIHQNHIFAVRCNKNVLNPYCFST